MKVVAIDGKLHAAPEWALAWKRAEPAQEVEAARFARWSRGSAWGADPSEHAQWLVDPREIEVVRRRAPGVIERVVELDVPDLSDESLSRWYLARCTSGATDHLNPPELIPRALSLVWPELTESVCAALYAAMRRCPDPEAN
jgi:hypothetical protein